MCQKVVYTIKVLDAVRIDYKEMSYLHLKLEIVKDYNKKWKHVGINKSMHTWKANKIYMYL